MLENDTKAFLEFFNDIKKNTNNAAQHLENLKADKNQAQQTLRSIQD